jgi:hypothetical protein
MTNATTKNVAAATNNTDFRRFLRENFRARFVRDENKHAITSVVGKTAKAEIQNYDTVFAELSEQGKIVAETKNSTTFAFGKGKVKSQITLALIGESKVLTMKAAS